MKELALLRIKAPTTVITDDTKGGQRLCFHPCDLFFLSGYKKKKGSVVEEI